MPKTSPFSPRKQLYFLTVVHTVIDSYATVLPHLLPLLLKKLASQTAARNSLAGIIISVYSTFSSLGPDLLRLGIRSVSDAPFCDLWRRVHRYCVEPIGHCTFTFFGTCAARDWRLRCCCFPPESHQPSSCARHRGERFCHINILDGRKHRARAWSFSSSCIWWCTDTG